MMAPLPVWWRAAMGREHCGLIDVGFGHAITLLMRLSALWGSDRGREGRPRRERREAVGG